MKQQTLTDHDIADYSDPTASRRPLRSASPSVPTSDLLLRWNQKIALTTITDPLDILRLHFGESMFARESMSHTPWSARRRWHRSRLPGHTHQYGSSRLGLAPNRKQSKESHVSRRSCPYPAPRQYPNFPRSHGRLTRYPSRNLILWYLGLLACTKTSSGWAAYAPQAKWKSRFFGSATKMEREFQRIRGGLMASTLLEFQIPTPRAPNRR